MRRGKKLTTHEVGDEVDLGRVSLEVRQIFGDRVVLLWRGDRSCVRTKSKRQAARDAAAHAEDTSVTPESET